MLRASLLVVSMLNVTAPAPAGDPCTTAADCVFDEGDACVWWSCEEGACVASDRLRGDMGATDGGCTPDGLVDLGDFMKALNCFGGADPCEGFPAQFPCEFINTDIAGQAGSCPADGFCNIHDANMVQTVFQGTNFCFCPLDGGPHPIIQRDLVPTAQDILGRDQVLTERKPNGAGGALRLFMTHPEEVAAAPSSGPTNIVVGAGGTRRVAVWLEDSGPGQLIGAYQMLLPTTAAPFGPATGVVQYVDNGTGTGDSIFIDTERSDWLFSDAQFNIDGIVAYREARSHAEFGAWYRLIVPGDEADPAVTGGPVYLGEFEITASADASGDHVFDLLSAITKTALFNHMGCPVEFDFVQPLLVSIAPSCASVADCADTDDDGLRDDVCLHWQCVDGGCISTDILFGDMGGQFGACMPDMTVDGNDRFHALSCFLNTTPGTGEDYECEDNPPLALNVDAGGQFGSCSVDGVCDGNDAFHALNLFAGLNTCGTLCTGGPEPEFGAVPVELGGAALSMTASRARIASGDTVEVEVRLDSPLEDLRGYQLHLGVSGGTAGTLELIDIVVREPNVLATPVGPERTWRAAKSGGALIESGAHWVASNPFIGQMVVGRDTPGVAVEPGYLATFVFQATSTARGRFAIELLSDDADPAQRTCLFPTLPNGRIAVAPVKPVVLTIR